MWKTTLIWGFVTTLCAFLMTAGIAFIRGEPLSLRHNSIGAVLSGIGVCILVKFDYLFPHTDIVVTLIGILLVCVFAVVRYRSQSF